MWLITIHLSFVWAVIVAVLISITHMEFSGNLLQKTYQAAVQVTQKAEQMIASGHYNSELVRSIAENVTARWQQLMYNAEERMKLIMASMNWFKTAEQVSKYSRNYSVFVVAILNLHSAMLVQLRTDQLKLLVKI